MAEDKSTGLDDTVPANDNSIPNGGDTANADIAPWEKLDRVVLSIARLIGRQMAREEFERLRTATANDNAPCKAGDDGADED